MFEKDNGPSSIETNVQEDTKEVISISIKSNKNDERKHPRLTLSEALKLKELYIIAFIFSFSGLVGNVFSANYKVTFAIQAKCINEFILIILYYQELWTNFHKK